MKIHMFGWDNFTTAKRLRHKAEVLKSMIAMAKTAIAFQYSSYAAI